MKKPISNLGAIATMILQNQGLSWEAMNKNIRIIEELGYDVCSGRRIKAWIIDRSVNAEPIIEYECSQQNKANSVHIVITEFANQLKNQKINPKFYIKGYDKAVDGVQNLIALIDSKLVKFTEPLDSHTLKGEKEWNQLLDLCQVVQSTGYYVYSNHRNCRIYETANPENVVVKVEYSYNRNAAVYEAISIFNNYLQTGKVKLLFYIEF